MLWVRLTTDFPATPTAIVIQTLISADCTSCPRCPPAPTHWPLSLISHVAARVSTPETQTCEFYILAQRLQIQRKHQNFWKQSTSNFPT